MVRNLIIPIFGRVYKDKSDGSYRCVTPPFMGYPKGEARMRNEATGWTFRAHGIQQHPDGTIEWDYSSGGYFDENARSQSTGNQIPRNSQ